MSQCRHLIFNSLNSFLEEADKEEAEKRPKKSQTAKSAGENEALGKETVDKTEKDSSSKEEKAVSEETNAPLSKTVLIEGIEIDIDELLKRDDDEDQYWVCFHYLQNTVSKVKPSKEKNLQETICILEGAILVPEKKFNFFGAPIQKAPEQVLNLRWQLSSSILSFVWHRSKLGPLQG